jgi:sortase A
VSPTTAPPLAPVAEGEPTAHLRIPRIGVDKIVVEGVGLPDLKKGPGHYPGTPLPGQAGNAAIAGHRTTYGAPFNRIDELKPGDEILVDTVQGSFRYLVAQQLIVSPKQVDVLNNKGDNRLTLTACHPKFSARQRIVVVALLAPGQKPVPRPARASGTEPPPPPLSELDTIDGAGAPALPAVLLAGGCAVIWLLAWTLGRRWRKWPAYAIGLPFFLVTLFYFFEEFSRLLPSNF